MNPVTLTLVDADGRPHEYVIVPHNARDGSRILWRLMALCSEPLARLAGGVVANTGAGGLKALASMDGAALAANIDFAGVGGDIKSAILSLLAGGGANGKGSTLADELVADLLRNTTRDGQSVGDVIAFGAAYTANYGELLRILWEVIRVNRFLSLPV